MAARGTLLRLTAWLWSVDVQPFVISWLLFVTAIRAEEIIIRPESELRDCPKLSDPSDLVDGYLKPTATVTCECGLAKIGVPPARAVWYVNYERQLNMSRTITISAQDDGTLFDCCANTEEHSYGFLLNRYSPKFAKGPTGVRAETNLSLPVEVCVNEGPPLDLLCMVPIAGVSPGANVSFTLMDGFTQQIKKFEMSPEAKVGSRSGENVYIYSQSVANLNSGSYTLSCRAHNSAFQDVGVAEDTIRFTLRGVLTLRISTSAAQSPPGDRDSCPKLQLEDSSNTAVDVLPSCGQRQNIVLDLPDQESIHIICPIEELQHSYRIICCHGPDVPNCSGNPNMKSNGNSTLQFGETGGFNSFGPIGGRERQADEEDADDGDESGDGDDDKDKAKKGVFVASSKPLSLQVGKDVVDGMQCVCEMTDPSQCYSGTRSSVAVLRLARKLPVSTEETRHSRVRPTQDNQSDVEDSLGDRLTLILVITAVTCLILVVVIGGALVWRRKRATDAAKRRSQTGVSSCENVALYSNHSKVVSGEHTAGERIYQPADEHI